MDRPLGPRPVRAATTPVSLLPFPDGDGRLTASATASTAPGDGSAPGDWLLCHSGLPCAASPRRRRTRHRIRATTCITEEGLIMTPPGDRPPPGARDGRDQRVLRLRQLHGREDLRRARPSTRRPRTASPRSAARRPRPSASGAVGRRLTRPTGRRHWLALAAVAVIGGSVPFVLFFEGLARATSTQAAFIHKTLVLWVALLAVPLLASGCLRRTGSPSRCSSPARSWLDGGADGRRSAGEAMILAATLLWAVEVVVVKCLLADAHAADPRRGADGRSARSCSSAGSRSPATRRLAASTPASGAGCCSRAAARRLRRHLVRRPRPRAGRRRHRGARARGAVVTAVLSGAVEGAPLAPSAGSA